MALISIITPVYNKENYIATAIESVINQSYKDIEYIIVDDGSKDNSPIIVDDYAKKDSRIKVIHQKNQWIYASFNNGIKQATGQYIYILNADDRLRNGALELIANVIGEYKPDVIWTKVLMHKADVNQNIIKYDYGNWNQKVTEDSYQNSNDSVRENWLFLSESLLNLNQANVYKRELMLRHPFRNDVYGADTFFNIDIAREVNTSYILSEPVYDFYEYENMGNASVGKYYCYEHEMFNELYIKQKKLADEWDLQSKEYVNYISRKRLINFSIELKNLLYCKEMDVEHKISKILSDANDEVVQSAVSNINAGAELERRILFGVDNLTKVECLEKNSDYLFLQEMIETLKQQKEIISKVTKITTQLNNKYHVGKFMENQMSDIKNYIKYYFKE